MIKTKSVVVHPRARNEASAAARWYRRQDSAVADQFVAEVEAAFKSVGVIGGAVLIYLHGTRRIILRRFPYLVIYWEMSDAWLVVAVAHAKRRPGYWRRRLPKRN